MTARLLAWFTAPEVETIKADPLFQQAERDIEELQTTDLDGAIIEEGRRLFSAQEGAMKTLDDKAKALLAIVLGLTSALVAGVSTGKLNLLASLPTLICLLASLAELLLVLRTAILWMPATIPELIEMARAKEYPRVLWFGLHRAIEARVVVQNWRLKHFAAAMWLLLIASWLIVLPLAVGAGE